MVYIICQAISLINVGNDTKMLFLDKANTDASENATTNKVRLMDWKYAVTLPLACVRARFYGKLILYVHDAF